SRNRKPHYSNPLAVHADGSAMGFSGQNACCFASLSSVHVTLAHQLSVAARGPFAKVWTPHSSWVSPRKYQLKSIVRTTTCLRPLTTRSHSPNLDSCRLPCGPLAPSKKSGEHISPTERAFSAALPHAAQGKGANKTRPVT